MRSTITGSCKISETPCISALLGREIQFTAGRGIRVSGPHQMGSGPNVISAISTLFDRHHDQRRIISKRSAAECCDNFQDPRQINGAERMRHIDPARCSPALRRARRLLGQKASACSSAFSLGSPPAPFSWRNRTVGEFTGISPFLLARRLAGASLTPFRGTRTIILEIRQCRGRLGRRQGPWCRREHSDTDMDR